MFHTVRQVAFITNGKENTFFMSDTYHIGTLYVSQTFIIMESVNETEDMLFYLCHTQGLICVPLMLRMMETALSTASRNSESLSLSAFVSFSR